MAKVVQRRGAHYLDFRDAHGVRQQKRFRTKAEAEDAFKALVPYSAQRRRQGPPARRVALDPRMTLAEWVARWLRQKRATLKPRAWDAYERACTRFIVPALGDVRVTRLQRADLKDFLLGVQVDGRAPCSRAACVRARADHGIPCPHAARPLAPGSVRHVYAALRAALQAAVDDGLLAANPAAKLGGARGLRFEPTTRERVQRIEQRVLALPELAALTTTTRDRARAWYPLLLVYARAGLRLGEAIALEVSDFRAEPPVLHVRQGFDYKRMTLEPPKFGPRDVDLSGSPELVAVLRAQVAGLKKRALKAGTPVGRWLFPSRDGGPVQARNVARALARLGRQAGLAHPLSAQDLRHTYGTRLIDAGVSPVYVQRQLGHAGIELTVNTYGVTARPKLPASAVGLFDGTPEAPMSPRRDAVGGEVVTFRRNGDMGEDGGDV
jgi:integrase